VGRTTAQMKRYAIASALCAAVAASVASYWLLRNSYVTGLALVSVLAVLRTIKSLNGGNPVANSAVMFGYVAFHVVMFALVWPSITLNRKREEVPGGIGMIGSTAALGVPIFLISQSWFWLHVALTLVVVFVVLKRSQWSLARRLVTWYSLIVLGAYTICLLVGPRVSPSEMP
jgi:hypothetical protein